MINIQRLIDLREMNGLSRKDLANKLSITEQNVWQYENRLIDPSFVVLRKLTDLFAVNPDYFFNVGSISHVAVKENLTYRTKRNQPTKPDKYELRYIDFVHYYIGYFEQFLAIKNRDLMSIQKNIHRKYNMLMTYEEHMKIIDDLASDVRESLIIKDNKEIMYILEQYGIYILERKLPNKQDAYSIWVKDTPYIVLNNSGQSETRRTYSLAHELGHLLMHRGIDISELTLTEYNNLEREADEFASCLLLPKEEINKAFVAINNPSDPKEYLFLEKQYHLPVSTIENRCYRLGLLNHCQHIAFCKSLNDLINFSNKNLNGNSTLTIPAKILYLVNFVLKNCISLDKVLAANEIKVEFLNKLFGFRKPFLINKI